MGKRSKRDFNKFEKRQTTKRGAKERARRELMNILDSISVSYDDSLKLHTAYDNGRRRSSAPPRGEELLAEGVFELSKNGYGFVRLDNGDRDIFVPAGRTLGALDGDTVSVSYKKYTGYTGDERTEGRVRKIIKIGKETLTGTLVAEQMRLGRGYRRVFFVDPDDRSFRARLSVSDLGGARLGEKVQAMIVRGEVPHCDIIKVFGSAEDRDTNYQAILADEGIECEFSHEEIVMAEKVAEEKISADGRVDRRGETVFTIDSESAKDLDDAISVRKIRGGYRLSVHIADVSHYVPERSVLERCAVSRGTSVYFTDKVVPMLPEALSNGVCSLVPGEDRLAFSAFLTFDREGRCIARRFAKSVIRSQVRFTYEQVMSLINGGTRKGMPKRQVGAVLAIHESITSLSDGASLSLLPTTMNRTPLLSKESISEAIAFTISSIKASTSA
jgi:ribonuclease R